MAGFDLHTVTDGMSPAEIGFALKSYKKRKTLSSYMGGATPLQTAVTEMNTNKTELVIDVDIEESNVVSTGYTDITGSGKVTQGNEVGRGFKVALPSTRVGTYTAVAQVSEPSGGVLVTKITGTFDTAIVKIGDIITVVDEHLLSVHQPAYTYIKFAETAMVQKVTSTELWLDCNLRHFEYFTGGGVINKLSRDKVSIKGISFKGKEGIGSVPITRIASLDIEGAVFAQIDVSVVDDINTGITLRGCYQADVNAVTSNLRDDADNNAFGYGVVEYGACKGNKITTNSVRTRCATSNGVWDNPELEAYEHGFVLDSHIYDSVSAGNFATSYDTHEYSDGVTFANCHALEGVSNGSGNTGNDIAFKLRGTNITVTGGVSHRGRAISDSTGYSALIDSVHDVQIVEKKKDDSASVVYYQNNSGKKLKLRVHDSYLVGTPYSTDNTGIDYLEFDNTTFKGTTYRRFVMASTKYYQIKFRRCVFEDFEPMFLDGGDLSFEDCVRVMTGTGSVNPIQLRYNTKVRAINMGCECDSVSFDSIFVCTNTTTVDTLFEHSGGWLKQRGSLDAGILLKTRDYPVTVRALTANTIAA